jgi:hypothetical protein
MTGRVPLEARRSRSDYLAIEIRSAYVAGHLRLCLPAPKFLALWRFARANASSRKQRNVPGCLAIQPRHLIYLLKQQSKECRDQRHFQGLLQFVLSRRLFRQYTSDTTALVKLR